MKKKRLLAICLVVFLILTVQSESSAQSLSPTIRAGFYSPENGDGNFMPVQDWESGF